MSSDAILVTGARGFIGRHLVNRLRSAGRHVIAHDIADGDIARCALDFEGVGHVFHLAGRSFVPDSWTRPRDFYETNVLGTANVLEHCRRSGASVTLVSSYVYGVPARLPIREDDPVRALNPYAHSKIMAEEIGSYYSRQFSVPVTVVRPFNIYGPGQQPPFLIPALITQALDPASSCITVADLRPRRDYLHVRDFVELLVSTIAGARSTYNAGSGQSVSVQDLVERINRLLPCPKQVVSRDERRQEEVLDVVADISRAAAELNWRPRVSLDEGLRETLEGTGAGHEKD